MKVIRIEEIDFDEENDENSDQKDMIVKVETTHQVNDSNVKKIS